MKKIALIFFALFSAPALAAPTIEIDIPAACKVQTGANSSTASTSGNTSRSFNTYVYELGVCPADPSILRITYNNSAVYFIRCTAELADYGTYFEMRRSPESFYVCDGANWVRKDFADCPQRRAVMKLERGDSASRMMYDCRMFSVGDCPEGYRGNQNATNIGECVAKCTGNQYWKKDGGCMPCDIPGYNCPASGIEIAYGDPRAEANKEPNRYKVQVSYQGRITGQESCEFGKACGNSLTEPPLPPGFKREIRVEAQPA